MRPAGARRALLVMAKQPVAGSTKTRLADRLTPSDAADLYECFLRDTLDLARSIDGVTPIVAVSPPDAGEYFRALAPDLEQIAQVGPTLDVRLDHVLTRAVERGFDAVVAMNSDSPTLPSGHVRAAFDQLTDPTVDVVLGPADDGGYYLIGWKRAHDELVRGVEMSTPDVLAETLDRARRLGVTVSVLDPWYDVDEPSDLDRLVAELAASAADDAPGPARHTRAFLTLTSLPGAPRPAEHGSPGGEVRAITGSTTVVVPALDEAGNIGSLVTELLAQSVDRLIVVDNGSADHTATVAAEAGAQVVVEPRQGYGYACAAGTRAALDAGAEIVAYIDADHSSRPDELAAVVAPIVDDDADLVLGSRVLGEIEGGAMAPHQRFGNLLVAALVRMLYGVRVTDAGPYRAIRADLLAGLDLGEMTFGWPTEMVVKAARRGARVVEVPVTWRERQAGRSKVSGTVRGSVLAGYHILRVTFRHRRGTSAPR